MSLPRSAYRSKRGYQAAEAKTRCRWSKGRTDRVAAAAVAVIQGLPGQFKGDDETAGRLRSEPPGPTSADPWEAYVPRIGTEQRQKTLVGSRRLRDEDALTSLTHAFEICSDQGLEVKIMIEVHPQWNAPTCR
jgi:hypothetical protein